MLHIPVLTHFCDLSKENCSVRKSLISFHAIRTAMPVSSVPLCPMFIFVKSGQLCIQKFVLRVNTFSFKFGSPNNIYTFTSFTTYKVWLYSVTTFNYI
jgi:hypothetical protein